MPTTVHLPTTLLDSVDQRARELGLSRNRYIIRALEHSLVAETQWSPRLVETLTAAREDEEARRDVEAMVADIARNRTRKTPPAL